MDHLNNSSSCCNKIINESIEKETRKQYYIKTVEEFNETEIQEELSNHKKFMEAAIEEGYKALKEGEVPVACVIVYKGEIIARGSNKTNIKKNGTRHAELEAFDQIFLNKELNDRFKDSLLEECDLYVTVEPCLMCSVALQFCKIKRVFFGCHNDKFGGNGSVYELNFSPISNGRPYNCITGLLKNQAILLLQLFYNQENKKAPIPNKRKRLDPEELKKEMLKITENSSSSQLILNITQDLNSVKEKVLKDLNNK